MQKNLREILERNGYQVSQVQKRSLFWDSISKGDKFTVVKREKSNVNASSI